MNKYYNNKFEKYVVNINMGEWYVSEEDIILQTILGSCISVCMFDISSRLCGMNHFMLPGKVKENEIGISKSSRYGIYAMEVLINEFIKRGIDKKNLRVKVFGGGNILNIKHDNLNIGKNNIIFALNYLKIENIPIISHDLGKDYSRTILFFTETKKVLQKKGDKTTSQITVLEEENFAKKYKDEKKDIEESQVILF